MKVVLGALGQFPSFAVLGLAGLCSLACGAVSRGSGTDGEGGSSQLGGSASTGAGTGAGNAAGSGGAGAFDPSSAGIQTFRILTQSEYKNALTDVLGAIRTPLELPSDTAVAGFVSIGASHIVVNGPAVTLYEAASRAASAEVFSDAARWQKLVGCQPDADLGDACLVEFIKNVGKRAYRRDLTELEVQRWQHVGRNAAQLPGSSAAHGLATVMSGLLQSVHFLYRIETNRFDASSGRLKYDGPSMAVRLAFLLTGRPPTDALLAAAAAGQLDTADGVRTAAAPLLDDASAVDQMAEFFNELSRVRFVSLIQKSPELFPSFNSALKSSMVQGTQLFIKNIVLAPTADVRSFYDSDQTFVDAALAPIYGVPAPASGFRQMTLGPEVGRAGILGQAGVIAAISQPDHNSPTRRGLYVLESLLCETSPAPPDGVFTFPPFDPNLTSRQRLQQATIGEPCAECHALFDPLGFALEHLDPIGQYRATEEGLTIDATGTLDGVAVDGQAELGAALSQNPRALACLVSNFYRAANGRADAKADSAQVESLEQTLRSNGYVWRDLVREFVVSDAFRSAPATTGNQ